MNKNEHIYTSVETVISDKLYELNLEDRVQDFIEKHGMGIAESVNELIDDLIEEELDKSRK